MLLVAFVWLEFVAKIALFPREYDCLPLRVVGHILCDVQTGKCRLLAGRMLLHILRAHYDDVVDALGNEFRQKKTDERRAAEETKKQE